MFGVQEEKPNRGSNKIRRSLTKRSQYAYAGSLLAFAALTAEVDTLKQNLEQSEQELGHAKKQLEDKEGKKYLV